MALLKLFNDTGRVTISERRGSYPTAPRHQPAKAWQTAYKRCREVSELHTECAHDETITAAQTASHRDIVMSCRFLLLGRVEARAGGGGLAAVAGADGGWGRAECGSAS